ncbi:glycyl-tRNA synthetase [Methanococcus maripaludis]|uniref:Glycine--tRNA ligase n=1 Tax=Methanococcus maripaludis TaxID=39152 RepID=A0A7J9P8A4_METMI|nr:glycine--tRNA ligase [Methanococcus maripaludis]MBA2858988.1 glycyl-tRNA synthetase [Methanococcus maripaludis]
MDKYDKIIDLTKRRGFLWNSFEIYGGIAGFFDYGPLGAILKNNVINTWRKHYIVNEGFYEIDSPTVTPYEVLKASGHVENFTDPLVECKDCLESFRADHIIEENIDVDTEGKTLQELQEMIEKNNIRCPKCGGEFKEVSTFNLMFATSIGPGGKRAAFMRPETAQGIFIQFKRISQFFRNKLPYGAVQIGKAYRNEISPRQGVIRLREFTQAEGEFFIDSRKKENFEKFESVKDMVLPLLSGKNQENESLSAEEKIVRMSLSDAVKNGIIAHEAIAYYIAVTKKFLMEIGIDESKLRFRQHLPNEMAHYAADCWDAELYTDRYGWIECVGVADRTNYDLLAHMKNSGDDLSVFVELDEDKEVEAYEIELNYKLVGRTFKGDAKVLEESLKELDDKKMEELVEALETEGKYVLKTCKRDFEILKEYLTAKKVKKIVKGEKIIPHVIEPSYGIDRITYCVMEHAFKEDEDRTVMGFSNAVSPIKVGVFPLVNKEGMPEIAMDLKNKLRENGLIAEYDDSGAIGRRYMRMDEVGTPFCITIDGETLKDRSVTIRERDSREQFRIPINEVVPYIKDKL